MKQTHLIRLFLCVLVAFVAFTSAYGFIKSVNTRIEKQGGAARACKTPDNLLSAIILRGIQ